MSIINCPLCCRQTFKSVLALREHLLYFTYRPVSCMLCGLSTNGIYELTRHLDDHLTATVKSTRGIQSDVECSSVINRKNISNCSSPFIEGNDGKIQYSIPYEINVGYDNSYTEPVCLKKNVESKSSLSLEKVNKLETPLENEVCSALSNSLANEAEQPPLVSVTATSYKTSRYCSSEESELISRHQPLQPIKEYNKTPSDISDSSLKIGNFKVLLKLSKFSL